MGPFRLRRRGRFSGYRATVGLRVPVPSARVALAAAALGAARAAALAALAAAALGAARASALASTTRVYRMQERLLRKVLD